MKTNAPWTTLSVSRVLLALWVAALTLPSLAFAGDEAKAPSASPASVAFEKLKSLEGKWDAEDSHRHVIELSASGTVVMETMAPGTEHEMINMYFLDGDRLLLTHYCAGGNQPQMELQPQTSANVMHFDFIGGTNLDPAVDQHIHSAKIILTDENTMESRWTGYQGGEEHHEMVFHLNRHGG